MNDTEILDQISKDLPMELFGDNSEQFEGRENLPNRVKQLLVNIIDLQKNEEQYKNVQDTLKNHIMRLESLIHNPKEEPSQSALWNGK